MFYTFRNQTIFFQAEHGIRDKLVTGVQTCALPICRRRVLPSGGWLCAWTSFGAPATGRRRSTACPPRDRSRLGRSEERRVGKECRSRWLRYHFNKKVNTIVNHTNHM